MDKHMLVLTSVQLDFLREALKETQEQFRTCEETFRDYTPEDVERFKAEMDSSVQALASAHRVEHLPRPTHDGEWGYRKKGEAAVTSVVFVDGVSKEDPGYVLSDLNDGALDGKSVESLDGTWQEVWIP